MKIKVLDLGCGLGLFGYTLNGLGVEYTGMDKSHWAVNMTAFKNLDIRQGDITEKQDFKDFDLVLVIDILEHLEEKDLDKTLNYIKEYGNKFIFSIPYDTDPNIDLDPTHRIKKPKSWWVKKLSKYMNISDAPKHWWYHHQILIGGKNKKN